MHLLRFYFVYFSFTARHLFHRVLQIVPSLSYRISNLSFKSAVDAGRWEPGERRDTTRLRAILTSLATD